MTLTAQESLSAHIFLLDQDNNILLESAGENTDLKDQKWWIRLMEILETFGLIWTGKLAIVYQTKLRYRTYGCRNDSYDS